VERGIVKIGDEVEIVGLHHEPKKTVVTGLEMFHKLLDFSEPGDAVGALLRGVERTDIERVRYGAPGSIKPRLKPKLSTFEQRGRRRLTHALPVTNLSYIGLLM
jgi:elongation factor Tu